MISIIIILAFGRGSSFSAIPSKLDGSRLIGALTFSSFYKSIVNDNIVISPQIFKPLTSFKWMSLLRIETQSDAYVHSQHADALGGAAGGDDVQHGLDGEEVGNA